MKTKFSPRLIVSVVALSLGLAGSVYALPRGDGPDGRPGMSMRGQAGMHGMKGMARLHDDLKLDAKQDALWQAAAKDGKDTMDAVRDQHRKQHDELLAQLKQPGADLRVALKKMDDFCAEAQKQRDARRDHWLAVYDSLNAEQKEKARVFFVNGMERMGSFGQERHHGMKRGR